MEAISSRGAALIRENLLGDTGEEGCGKRDMSRETFEVIDKRGRLSRYIAGPSLDGDCICKRSHLLHFSQLDQSL